MWHHPQIDLTEADFPHPDHVNQHWHSASHRWGLTMSQPVETGWLLYGLLRGVRPRTCVETGTHRGLASLFLGHALRDNAQGHLHTVDIEDYGQRDTIAMHGLGDWVSVTIAPSTTLRVRGLIDVLFLDAAHGGEPVRAELDHFGPQLAGGALVVIDDCRYHGDQMRAVADWAAANRVDCPGLQLLSSRGLWIGKVGLGREVYPGDLDPERVVCGSLFADVPALAGA